MAKILLVEDDNNLREIYEARLQAEGYEIVSAPDGEAALVVAKKELPDLVISDVMMPRVSGFEMLDIMRNTEGLKHVKVIMLTALGQAEDKTRADSLGADKYLVKSQVTLEDIVKTAAELLGGETAPAPTTPSTVAAAAEFAQTQTPAAVPSAAPPTQVAPVAVAEPPATVPVATPPAPTPPPAIPVTAPAPVAPAAPATPVSQPTAAPIMPSAPNPAAQATAIPVPNPAPAPPPDLTAAPIPAPNPPAATPATPPAPVNPADEHLVANAVKNLLSGTAPDQAPVAPGAPAVTTPPAPAAPAPVSPLAPIAQPVAPTPPAPAAPTPAAAPTPPVDESGSKKIIQPLPSGTTPAPTDLNELMAKEGHALDAVSPQENPLPHQPGLVISPNPVNAAGQPEDPNKISL